MDEKLKDAIYDIADDFYKKYPSTYIYKFVNYLVNQLEKRMK